MKKGYPAIFKQKQKKKKQEEGACSKCGSVNYLQVHHIDRNKANNDDSILELLCFNCHKAHHEHLRLPFFLART
jgi:RNA-directed DNA polymerase